MAVGQNPEPETRVIRLTSDLPGSLFYLFLAIYWYHHWAPRLARRDKLEALACPTTTGPAWSS